MVNSANVKSLLMRLYLENQGNSGQSRTANQMSFAKNLDASLGTVGAAKSESNLRPAIPQKTAATLPASQLIDSTDAAFKDKSESAKSPDGQVIERPLPQVIDAKEIGAEPAIGTEPNAENDAATKKNAIAVPAVSSEANEEKAAIEKPKIHKGYAESHANRATASVPGIPESKQLATDQSQQATFVDTRLPMPNPSLIAQPPATDPSGTDKSEDGAVVTAGGTKISSVATARKAAALTTKVNANALDSHKSKDVGSAGVGDEQTHSVDSRTQKSALNERDEAPVLAKVAHVIEGVHAAANPDMTHASVGVAPAVGSVDHELVSSKSTIGASPAELAQGMTDRGDGRAAEPRVASFQEHRTLAVTPSTLEVGVADGTHGWLKIRAELTDTGSIKAAISSTSAAGQEMLHRELNSLSSFLDQERVPLSSLVVHHTAASSGLYAGADGGSGAAGQQQGDSSGTARQGQVRDLDPLDESVPEGLLEIQPGDLMASSGLATGGGWLSVRA